MLNKAATVQNESKSCRICLENTGQLISPCQCSGSLEFIHEICLKTWLLSKYNRIEHSKCEICNTKYRMKYKKALKCDLKIMMNKGMAPCIYMPILSIILGALSYLMYNFVQKLGSNPLNGSGKANLIGLVFCSTATLAVLIGITIKIIRNSCFGMKIQDWIILDYKKNKIKTLYDKPIHHRKKKKKKYHSDRYRKDKTILLSV